MNVVIRFISPLYSEAEWAARQQEMAEQEQARLALEARTIDKIFCGEQQSESDHFFASERSWNGSEEGLHWRRTRSSFSYQLKTTAATLLRIQSIAGDRQPLRLRLDDHDLGTFQPQPDGVLEVQLPEGLQLEKAMLTLSAEPERETPRIVEIRVCK